MMFLPLLCLCAAGFISSLEAGLMGVPVARLRAALEREEPEAIRMRYWLQASDKILFTFHFLRLCCVLAAGVTAVRGLERLPTQWTPYDGVTIVVMAGLGFLVAHLMPRLLAKRWSSRWAVLSMPFVHGLTVVMTPVIWPFLGFSRAVARISGLSSANVFWTPEELEHLNTAARAEAIGQRNEDLLRSIIAFSDTVIKEIMVPRTAMVTVSVTASVEDVIRTVIDAGHSRIPVYEDTVDNIVGLLHIKELFAAVLRQQMHHATATPSSPLSASVSERLHVNLRTLLRPTFYVPEVMQISELLREFQRRKTHMAIAVDEYGGTAGVVTLEDIIEEIVGDIQDEYDVDEKQFRVLGDKVIADARVHIWDLEHALGASFPEDGDYETLAGFIMVHLGYIPSAGAVFTWKNLRFTVKEANEKRIGMVEIERRGKPDVAAAPALMPAVTPLQSAAVPSAANVTPAPVALQDVSERRA